MVPDFIYVNYSVWRYVNDEVIDCCNANFFLPVLANGKLQSFSRFQFPRFPRDGDLWLNSLFNRQ